MAEQVYAKDSKGRFVTGNIGGGRPKGSKNALTEAFTSALHDDFVEHGAAAIVTVRTEKPDQYLKIVASLVAKDVNLSVSNVDDLSDAELAERIQSLASQLSPFLTGGTGDPNEGDGSAAGPKKPAGLH